MSLGALGLYGSDSSISDSEGEKEKGEGSVPEKSIHNAFTCIDPLSLSGEQAPSDSDSDIPSSPFSPLPPSCPLPLPDIESIVAKSASHSVSDVNSGSPSNNKSSVFSNRYQQTEQAKVAILKKHVQEFDQKPKTKGSSPPPSHRHYRKRSGGNRVNAAEPGDVFDGSDHSLSTQVGRKHRSGVTDSLHPPKKFMKMYNKIYTK